MEIRRLNTIRGMAALIVMVSHYGNESGIRAGALGKGAGQLGVMLFFLLSAFLMAHLYLDLPATATALKRYAIARVARVVPLFLLVLTICCAVDASQIEELKDLFPRIGSLQVLLAHLTFLYGENFLWTIPPEIQFYVLFACIWRVRPLLPGRVLIAMGAILCCLSFWFPALPKSAAWVVGFPIAFSLVFALPSFFVGMLMGALFRKRHSLERFQHHGFVASLAIIPLLFPAVFRYLTGFDHSTWNSFGILACMSAIFFAAIFLVPEGNRLLESRLGDKAGHYSYSLYLLHYPVLLALKKAGLVSGLGGLALFLFSSFLLAHLCFTLFEAPVRRYIRYWNAGGG